MTDHKKSFICKLYSKELQVMKSRSMESNQTRLSERTRESFTLHHALSVRKREKRKKNVWKVYLLFVLAFAITQILDSL